MKKEHLFYLDVHPYSQVEIHICQLHFWGKLTANYLEDFFKHQFVAISETVQFRRLKSGFRFKEKKLANGVPICL